MKIDLNCDLGEGEPIFKTAALMRGITSANIACGGHAGDVASMTACVRLAAKHGIHLGAHPGTLDGRASSPIMPDELELLLLQQMGTLERIARREGKRLHHVKLHGGLYHQSDSDRFLAKRYVSVVKAWWPKLIIYARHGGRVGEMARECGVPVWDEAFADRRYRRDGTLMPRSDAGAVIIDLAEVKAQARDIILNERVRAVSGYYVRCRARTLCIHSDTPGAVAMIKALAEA